MKVQVAVDTAEEALSRAPTATRPEDDQVVMPTLDLVQDLMSGVPTRLHPLSVELLGNQLGRLLEDVRGPLIEFGGHRLDTHAAERDVSRRRRRDRHQH